jgi:hypothetical protein
MPIREPIDSERIAHVMRNGRVELTEADFYDMIEESLNEPAESRRWPYYALDFVASLDEWATFVAALAAWLADHHADASEGFDQCDAEAADERRARHLRPVPDPQ